MKAMIFLSFLLAVIAVDDVEVKRATNTRLPRDIQYKADLPVDTINLSNFLKGDTIKWDHIFKDIEQHINIFGAEIPQPIKETLTNKYHLWIGYGPSKFTAATTVDRFTGQLSRDGGQIFVHRHKPERDNNRLGLPGGILCSHISDKIAPITCSAAQVKMMHDGFNPKVAFAGLHYDSIGKNKKFESGELFDWDKLCQGSLVGWRHIFSKLDDNNQRKLLFIIEITYVSKQRKTYECHSNKRSKDIKTLYLGYTMLEAGHFAMDLFMAGTIYYRYKDFTIRVFHASMRKFPKEKEGQYKYQNIHFIERTWLVWNQKTSQQKKTNMDIDILSFMRLYQEYSHGRKRLNTENELGEVHPIFRDDIEMEKYFMNPDLDWANLQKSISYWTGIPIMQCVYFHIRSMRFAGINAWKHDLKKNIAKQTRCDETFNENVEQLMNQERNVILSEADFETYGTLVTDRIKQQKSKKVKNWEECLKKLGMWPIDDIIFPQQFGGTCETNIRKEYSKVDEDDSEIREYVRLF